MVSASEIRNFCFSGLKRLKIFNVFLILYKINKKKSQNWRWKYGLHLKKTAKPTNNIQLFEYKSKLDFSVKLNIFQIKENIIALYKNSIRLNHLNTKDFRASGGKRLPWPKNYTVYYDSQDNHSWERLYWVLDTDIKVVKIKLNQWFKTAPNEYRLHSYTVSERIINLSEFIGVEEKIDDDLFNKIILQIFNDAEWLNTHIEFHLNVHNHILNNARALFTSSQIYKGHNKSRIWLKKARAIWEEYLPKLINDEGFFLEDSSFYHIMLTRTALDYYADIKNSNLHISEDLKEKIKKMCTITNLLFRADGSFPIFGDASPDMPSHWLRGIPVISYKMNLLKEYPRDVFSGYAGGANKIVESKIIKKRDDISREQWSMKLFKNSGLLFCRNNQLDLELTAMGNPKVESFGHSDSGKGSFEIWYRGNKIVIDGGIPEYGLSKRAKYFKSHKGQNSIALNNLSPSLLEYERLFFPDWYTANQKPSKWKILDNKIKFKHYGFCRINEDLVWERIWSLLNNKIVISDHINGPKNKIMFNSSIHFCKDNWSLSDSNSIQSEDCHLLIDSLQEINIDLLEMDYSPNYGVVKKSKGLNIYGEVKLPFILNYTFDLKI